jgi:hypothetical protein
MKWLPLLIRVREVWASDLGPEPGYPEQFFLFSSGLTGKWRDDASRVGHDRFIPYLSKSLFIIIFYSVWN